MTATTRRAAGTRHGAVALDGGLTRFSVFAPDVELVELVVDGAPNRPLGREHDGYHVAVLEAAPGTRYRYLLDGQGPLADPASRAQPDGVHGPSAVLDTTAFRAATHRGGPWRGIPLASQVICEIHVGTFSPEGTFDGVVAALGELANAGYSVLELLPVASFPGTRNWGYDGVFPFAVQESYGGAQGLARLTDAAHDAGLAVHLDVVYNHLGPEGAVQERFGPYLTDRYLTPWGKAVNVDSQWSDEVRRYFVEHALFLIRELGADGLRLDAVHEIPDASSSPFLKELAAAVHAEGRRLGRSVSVIAESPANDPRLIGSSEHGGIGCDGIWNDDFHHALRVALTGEHDRYFGDYRGIGDLAAALTSGFVLTGRRSSSRMRRHGAPPATPLGGEHLVVFAQNHDQIGNAGFGMRLTTRLDLEAQFPIAAIVLLSGWVPLRFMGEEYGETAPFHFFVDHSDADLVEQVRSGRRDEIGEANGHHSPDPMDPATFESCRIDRALARAGVHKRLVEWQRRLLALRREEPALGSLEPERSSCWYDEEVKTLVLVRRANAYLGASDVAVVVHLGDGDVALACPLLEGCGLDVLAAQGAKGLEDGERVTPASSGQSSLFLERYGVLVGSLRRPSGDHYHHGDGTAVSSVPAQPPPT